ncbi:mRNA-decapping enzyme 1A [Cynoglossus semilaevis]|uniref:mRNA-decapping enzyme 1A n=1 Tax=Cynoglossus semilaevis TaxID=244447 RepID=UPI000496FAD7|nr:mRNA-decapping enzyme 1A [Cynoglossus semilaevis]
MDTVNAGHMMSLAALKRQDPYINKLLDVTGQVALYNFNSKSNEWEKTEIEGTLFVYSRSASPHHGFTIMNRLSTENLVEPINKDLEFQLQDPFLLYRNGNLGIYSIWFYDKMDCHRIAQLMVKIVKQETDHAKRDSPERRESGRTNGVAEPRPIDILELLSKAKEEYQRTQTDVPTDSQVKTAISTAARLHGTAQSEKSSRTVVKQITVEELFGSSLPKDPSLPAMPAQNAPSSSSGPSTTLTQIQSYPTSNHQIPASNQQHQVPGLLPAPYALHPSPVFQSVVPLSEPQIRGSVSPFVVPPPETHAAPPPPASTSTSGTNLGQEILSSLKPAVVPSVNSDIHKQILAPSFLPSTLVPPQSFQELKVNLHQSKDIDVFSQTPNLIKPLSAVSMSPGFAVPGPPMSLLLSPSAFQQSTSKATTTTTGALAASVALPALSEPSPCTVGGVEPPPALCSRTQLQETLIHLIKNDPDFLSAIYDAYLQTVSKDFSSMKL